MKRIFLIAAAVLIITGAAWGQVTNVNNYFDTWFYGAESTESAASMGIFTSDVDNYIWVNDYDPAIGNFFFIGGGDGNGNPLSTQNHLSLGYGKTSEKSYFGLYYGGNLVNGSGNRNDKVYTSNNTWNNQIVVLLGFGNKGALRFDLGFSPTVVNRINDGEVTDETITNPAILGITYGGFKLADMASYVSLGIGFPQTNITTVGGTKTTRTQNGFFGIQFGLAAESGFSSDALLLFDIASAVDNTSNKDGSFGVALRAAYTKTVEMEKFAFGFSPNAALGLLAPEDKDVNRGFAFNVGLDLGAKFQLHEKFALYTGAGLVLFNWGTSFADDGKSDAWEVEGISWDTTRLQFGLTFAPAKNVIIGADISTFVDKIFYVDVANMEAGAGDFFNNSGSGNLGDWATRIFRGLSFNLTISCKF